MSDAKVLLVGWDAADWKVIRPLMAAGKMPNISRLVNEGCTAPIATLQPSFSPMLWTSIATGKRPFHHGIHGFMEPRADGRGVQRVTNLSRTTKAIWNILGQNGKRSIVVGWWPSYPSEPIHGAMVSDHFHRIEPNFKMLPGIVHPPEFGDSLAALRLNPEEMPRDLMEAFIPRAAEIDQQKDRRLHSSARTIAECANIHSAATWLMDRVDWDLCAVYFDAIDHFGHGYMKFNPPRRPAIAEEDFDLYHGVLQAGYELHDKMLGTLIEKAPGATVILISDHGFHPDHLRPAYIPQLHAGPATEHRNNGIFAIAGPGIRPGAELAGVGLLDIAPTVLSLFGLPAGADMEGTVVTSAFQTAPAASRIPSWDQVEGNDGRHPPHMHLDPMAASESLEQLVALGYVEEPDADHDKAVKSTIVDLRTNLAEAYQDAGRHRDAIAILRELAASAENHNDQRIALRLFLSSIALRQIEEMEAIADDWSMRRRELYEETLPKIGELRHPDQRAERKQLRRICRYDPSLAVFFRVQVFRTKRHWEEALAALDKIPATDLIRPGLFIDRAELLGRLNRWTEAQQTVSEALAVDPADARAHFAAARVALHFNNFTGAAQSALNGLELLDLEPYGHYLLGIALAKLRDFNHAILAFNKALAINPNFPQAHLWLARMYRRELVDPRRAQTHARACAELMRRTKPPAPKKPLPAAAAPKPVAFAASARDLPPLDGEAVIVSGLPRSGTSMLMQMLVAGGLTPLTDNLRQPDEDNPRGYFEFELVKQMASDTSWIDQARGKVVKIVAPMIPNLPDDLPCRVILIERDIEEILASQRQMISRRGREVDETPARLNRLRQEYLRLIVWAKGFLASRPSTSLMCVNRAAILRDPQRAADAFNRFLGGNLHTDRMAAEVRPELNRQRRVSSST